jgi:hypothetical protein
VAIHRFIPSYVQAEPNIDVLRLLDGRAGPLGHAGTAQSAGPTKVRRLRATIYNHLPQDWRQGRRLSVPAGVDRRRPCKNRLISKAHGNYFQREAREDRGGRIEGGRRPPSHISAPYFSVMALLRSERWRSEIFQSRAVIRAAMPIFKARSKRGTRTIFLPRFRLGMFSCF